jgi:hypothetical protein
MSKWHVESIFGAVTITEAALCNPDKPYLLALTVAIWGGLYIFEKL